MTLIDYGGKIGEHLALGHALIASGQIIAVKYCASACLMILAMFAAKPETMKRLCVYPDAWIGYHVHPFANGSESPTTMRWERGRDWIAKGYTPC